jgi:hypothetical protein
MRLPFVLNHPHLILGVDESLNRSRGYVHEALRAPATTGANGCATCPFRWNGRTR